MNHDIRQIRTRSPILIDCRFVFANGDILIIRSGVCDPNAGRNGNGKGRSSAMSRVGGIMPSVAYGDAAGVHWIVNFRPV